MASTYKNIPREEGAEPSILVDSSSPALVVRQSGDDVHLSLDGSRLTVERASSVVNTYTCGEVISALQAVYENGGLIWRCSPDTLFHANAIGVSLQASGPGGEIEVLQYGVITDPAFSFTNADLLFVSVNGSISTVAPTAGYLTRLGRAVNQNTALIIIDSPKTL